MSDLTACTVAPTRPLPLVGLVATGVVASACLGGITNAINGRVSALYFVRVMRWYEVEDVWRASIAQGIFEGICFGVVFSLLFAVGVGIITQASCCYGFAVRHLLAIHVSALACWAFGGVAGVGLALISPERFQLAFNGVPDELEPMLKFAWVGGSIWGVQFGGFVSLILGLVVLRANWFRLRGSE